MLERIFAINEIPLDYEDHHFLKNEGLSQMREDGLEVVNYKRLLHFMFPIEDCFEDSMMIRAVKVIARIHRKIVEKRREKKKRQEEVKTPSSKVRSPSKRNFLRDSSMRKKRKDEGEGRKEDGGRKDELKGRKEEVEGRKEVGGRKEEGGRREEGGWRRMEAGGKKEEGSKKLAAQKKDLLMRKGKPADVSSSLLTLLPKPKADPLHEEKLQSLSLFIKEILSEIIEKAVLSGQSLLLSREIQQKYQKRPVLKEIFVCLKEFEWEVLDLMGRSLMSSFKMGRVGGVEGGGAMEEGGRGRVDEGKKSGEGGRKAGGGELIQWEVGSGRKLQPIKLGGQIPIGSRDVLDVQFDEKNQKMYVLTSNFVLEGWDLIQESSTPEGRLRLPLPPSSFPSAAAASSSSSSSSLFTTAWLALYEGGCIVNSLGSFIFVDGSSFCVEKRVYLNLKDFKLSNSVMKTITRLRMRLKEMEEGGRRMRKKEGRMNEEGRRKRDEEGRMNEEDGLYEGGWEEEQEGGGRGRMSKTDFAWFLKKKFGDLLKDDIEVKELVEFLNQNNDEYISRQEYEFLFELARILEPPSTKNITINLNLGILTRKARKTLDDLATFIRKEGLSLETAFKVFDKSGNAKISYSEFSQMLDRITERSIERSTERIINSSMERSAERSVPPDVKEELARLLDKDGNGVITFSEFKSVFEGVIDPKNDEEDIRKNIMLCFHHVIKFFCLILM